MEADLEYQASYERKPNPYRRFRRLARAVTMLCKICRICQNLVYDSVAGEDWFKMVGQFVDNEELFQKKDTRRPRPFIAFVAGEDKGELVQLQFDKSEFCREYNSEYLLTDEIREILKIKQTLRTQQQVNELVRFLKRLSSAFNNYPLDIQRRLVKCMHYDKYMPGRIILKKDSTADGFYFALSGILVQKTASDMEELSPGDKFGEEDMKCGCPRRATVVTKSVVEMLTVHRLDYRAIFNMADDSNDPRYLDICRQDLVFHHFPMKKLVENPTVWTVLAYKYGRLIVRDSNEVDWVYIIKSGEARVIKSVAVGRVDCKERKKHHREKLKDDPYHSTRQLIGFIEDRTNNTSRYKPSANRPRAGGMRHLHSAPAHCGRPGRGGRRFGSFVSLPSTPSPGNRFSTRTSPREDRDVTQLGEKQSPGGGQTSPGPSKVQCIVEEAEDDDDKHEESRDWPPRNSLQANRTPSPSTSSDGAKNTRVGENRGTAETVQSRDARDGDNRSKACDSLVGIVSKDELHNDSDSGQQSGRKSNEHQGASIDRTNSRPDVTVTPATSSGSRRHRRSSFIQTAPSKELPEINQGKTTPARRPSPNVEHKETQFVQIESLRPGNVFGLRSCLDPEEQGPSASLVSGGCEVLQINKKFFMKYADEAVLGLIKYKSKPFPSEEELLDRLDVNRQWQRYKESTVVDLFRHRGKTGPCYVTSYVS